MLMELDLLFLSQGRDTITPMLRTQQPEGSTGNDPYVAFRRRTERMQTRKVRVGERNFALSSPTTTPLFLSLRTDKLKKHIMSIC